MTLMIWILILLPTVTSYYSNWQCGGWKCAKTRPNCMQGCVDNCGCCIPCPYLELYQHCSPVWSETGQYYVAIGLCAPGLLCDPIYRVCLKKSPFYKPFYPTPPFMYSNLKTVQSYG